MIAVVKILIFGKLSASKIKSFLLKKCTLQSCRKNRNDRKGLSLTALTLNTDNIEKVK